jgi:hypothetical protein
MLKNVLNLGQIVESEAKKKRGAKKHESPVVEPTGVFPEYLKPNAPLYISARIIGFCAI